MALIPLTVVVVHILLRIIRAEKVIVMNLSSSGDNRARAVLVPKFRDIPMLPTHKHAIESVGWLV